MKAKGKEVTPEEEQKLLDEIKDRYEKQTTPYYAAARLWVDAIIDPAGNKEDDFRRHQAANHNPDNGRYLKQVFSRFESYLISIILN